MDLLRDYMNEHYAAARNQQMMRLDSEITKNLAPEDEKRLLENVQSYITKVDPHILIFEDYDKGILTESVIREVIGICQKAGVVTSVDPKRKHFFSYEGVDIFKPNMKEVREALNLLIEEVTPSLLKDIHQQLQEKLHHKISVITLADKGIFYQQDKDTSLIPSHLRNISDVSGAGDHGQSAA